MLPVPRRRRNSTSTGNPVATGLPRPGSVVLVALLALTLLPVASAHDGTAAGGLTRAHGIGVALGGVLVLGVSIVLKRIDRVSPTHALYGVFLGIVVAALGAVLFNGLSPDPTYSGASIPFPRSWYAPLALSMGLLVAVLSFVVVLWRWPERPRYSFLGILMALWISYPYLISGPASTTHPLGYAIVLATPVVVGYVVWTDAGRVLSAVMRDRVARRFGLGIAVVVALFFVSLTGYLSFFPEEGIPHSTVVVVLPVVYQLVMWPTLEIAMPHVPFFLAVSPGQLIIVGLLSVLVGLNAAVIARHWRVDEGAGLTQGTAGTAAIVGSCTCGCCGPLVAKVTLLAAGPSIAAPLYWIFVDSASPMSAVIIVGSYVLFSGSLVYSVEAARTSDGSTDIVPAD